MQESPGIQLLIAEDSAIVRERLVSLAGEYLQPHAIQTAATGADAVAAFDRARPDAVLLDIGLPDMSGLAVLEHIRRQGASTEVIIFSNSGGPEMVARCHLLGADHFVDKAQDVGPVIELLRTIAQPRGKEVSNEVTNGTLSPRKDKGSVPTERSTAKPVSLLIVEDDASQASPLIKLLQRKLPAGSTIAQARSLGPALELMKADAYQVVLLDLGLPDCDGVEALVAVRHANADSAIIVLTARDDEETIASAMVAGADDYFVKGELSVSGLTRAIVYAAEGKRSERALSSALESRTRIMDSSADVICTVDAAGRFAEVGGASTLIWGYEPADLVGRNARDWVAEQDLPKTEEFFTSVHNGKTVRGFEHRFLRSDGTWVPMMWSGAWSATDRLMYCVARDVTERVSASEKLKAQETQYRVLFESNPNAMWVYDLNDLRILATNDAAVAQYGYSHGEFAALDLFALHPAEDREAVASAISPEGAAARHGGTWRHLTKDGSLMLVDVYSSPTPFEGAPARMAVLLDVTEQKRAEELLRESERAQRTIAAELETERAGLVAAQAVAKLGSWEVDVRTQVESWSEESYRILELDASLTATHQLFLQVVHPEDRAGMDAAFVSSLAEPAVYVREHRLLLPDGRVKCVHQHWQVFHDEQGKAARAAGTIQDVTERVLAREALQRERELLSALVENVSDGIVSCDAEGVITFFNGATREFHGLPAEPIPADRWAEHFDLYLPDAKTLMPKEQIPLFRALSDGSVHGAEIVIAPRGGPMRRVVASGRSFTNALGETTGAVVAMHDVTATKEAEEKLSRSHQALRQSEAELRTLVESIPQIVWITQPDGKHIHFNQQWLDYTGLTMEESVGDGWNPPFHPEDRGHAATRWQAAVSSGETYEIEYRLRRSDGVYHWMLGRALPLRDSSGAIVKWFGTCTDIEELKQAEQIAQQHAREQRELVAQLATDRARLVTAQRVAKVGDWDVDFVTQSRTWSAETYRIFEVEADQMSATHDGFMEIVHPEDRAALKAASDASFRNSSPALVKHRLVMPDGRIKFIEQRRQVTFDESGNAIRSTGTVQDITEREEAQEILRRSETNLALAQSVSHTGSWEIAFDGTETNGNLDLNWSDEEFRIFGFEPGAIHATQNMFFDLVHVDDREPMRAAFAAAFQSPDHMAFDVEHRITWPDGTEREVHEKAVFLRDEESGAVTRVLGTTQDITERKRAERTLLQQAEMLNLAHDAIVVRGAEDRVITFWNKGAEHLYGWTATEAIGQRIDDLLFDDQEHFEAVAITSDAAGNRGEVRQVAKDGRALVVNAGATIIRNSDGTPHSVLLIQTDVTEHKKLESQFLRAQRLESIGTLASGVAHDLNNVLAPILMSAPLLRDDLPQAMKIQIVDTIEKSAERGAQIVKQVLTFARGVDGERVLLDPRHLIKDMAEIAEQTFPKTIQVTTRYPEDLALVEGDPTQLHQVLLNLAVNARDAMPSGGRITLSAENFDVDDHYAAMTPGTTPGPHILINVTDTGTGIPAHVMEKMFDPFFTTKGIGKGTGLGLSTVLGIVKSHAGAVNAYSTPSGTTFRVLLPAAGTGEIRSPGAATELPPGRGETILIVDDEPAIREVARVLLERNGYQVLLADDGPAALAVYAQRREEITLVLTDFLMPIMDGVSLARIIRKMDPDARLIISSGREDDCSAAELEAIGIAASLTKPYTQVTLLRTLHRVLHGDEALAS